MKLSDLSGQPVAVLGLGKDMVVALPRLLEARPAQVVVVDAAPDRARRRLQELGLADVPVLGELRPAPVATLAVRSPGYPLYHPEVQRRARAGMATTTPLDLWLGERGARPSVAVTGTKGKSSTAVLIGQALGRLGVGSHVLGNIGVPPWEVEPSTDLHAVLEVSSFLCADLHTGTAVSALTALGQDHIDWHGSLDRYHRDKAHLFRLAPASGEAPWRGALDDLVLPPAFDGTEIVRVPAPPGGTRERNCTLAAAAALSAAHPGEPVDGTAMADLAREILADYPRLPGRFSTVARAGGVEYIDDALASNPLGVSAALGSLGEREAALIVGGKDRGADLRLVLRSFVDRAARSSLVLIDDATDLAGELQPVCGTVEVAASLEDAVRRAGRLVGPAGAVVFSPGMPTPPSQGDWQARSSRFRAAVALMAAGSLDDSAHVGPADRAG